jgi:hypothetical protein
MDGRSCRHERAVLGRRFLCTIAAVGKAAAGAVSGAAGDVVSSAWQQVCQSFTDAATQMLKAFAAAFVAIPDVNLG